MTLVNMRFKFYDFIVLFLVVQVEEITRQAFWTNSNTFIQTYLSPTNATGVVLNTMESA